MVELFEALSTFIALVVTAIVVVPAFYVLGVIAFALLGL